MLSTADGMGIGLGFTLSLGALGAVRELLGNGTVLGMDVFGPSFEPFSFMVEAPGAFIGLGLMLCIMNLVSSK
jgi:electron transport complex protein RnfE